MMKMIKLTWRLFLYASAVLVMLTILDKSAGKILRMIDPEFSNLLLAKLKRGDVQTTKEKVLHILKPVYSNGTTVPVSEN